MQIVFNPFTGNFDYVNPKSTSNGNNFITNPNAEIDTSGWNLYNNIGRTVPASLVNQDITFTSTLSGSGGNGVEIEYIYNASYPASAPNINVISSSHVQVQWNNGPTIANNPTATQLADAWNAVGAATAIATIAITGTAGNLQYITGAGFLSNGGDTAPTNGTGGTATGVTFTRNTVAPLTGNADFLLSKDANSREGEGVSTDFTVNNLDKGNLLEVSFNYVSSAGMVFGTSSDLTVWIYDVTNAVLIPISPRYTLIGPASTITTFVGTFSASQTSINYRLIFHISTSNATAWNIQLDSVVVTDNVSIATTQVPSLVIPAQPVSGAVTDHMCVMWRDGASQWVPATIAGAAIPAFGTDQTQLGFATNIVGGVADIFIRGYMGGFSFGPFTGFDQYIDNVAGGISPLPSPFTDLYVIVGMAISSTVLNIQFNAHVDLISNGSGTPLKGGLLTSSAVNDGTGDVVLPVGANGNALIANSAAADGIQWAAPIVATTPFTFTLATRTLTIATSTNAVAGVLSSADHTTYSGYAATIATLAPLNSPSFTGTPSLPTGTTGITQTAGNSTTALATTAFVTTANNLKANLASPTFTGTPSLPTGTTGVTQTAGNSTTALATTAFATTADNLKANLSGASFTGGVIITTTTAALTLPRLTSTQETALTAVEGMLIYNTTLHKMRIRTASAWETVTSA